MYRMFVSFLLDDLDKRLVSFRPFLVRDIIFTLLRTMACDNTKNMLKISNSLDESEIMAVMNNDIFTGSCDLLYRVCKAALTFSAQVCHILVLFSPSSYPALPALICFVLQATVDCAKRKNCTSRLCQILFFRGLCVNLKFF